MVELKAKVILFGASRAGESFIEYAKKANEYEILAIADNDITKQNTFFYGYPVIAPAQISEFEYDFIIITSAFALQIQDQLITELKVNKSKIKAAPKSISVPTKSYRAFEDRNTINLARDVLLCIIDLFESEKIPYFIDHGTLLGIIRDGDIIPWDDDIDISIYYEDMIKAIRCIEENISRLPMNEMLAWTLNVYYEENDILNVIEITFDQNNKMNIIKFSISIKSIIFKNKFAIQKVTYAPEYHFKKSERINYRGRMVSVPFDYEKYLEFHYGDWTIPKKDCSILDIKNYRDPVYTIKKEDRR